MNFKNSSFELENKMKQLVLLGAAIFALVLAAPMSFADDVSQESTSENSSVIEPISFFGFGRPGLVLGTNNRISKPETMHRPAHIDLNKVRNCEVDFWKGGKSLYTLSNRLFNYSLGFILTCDGFQNYYAFTSIGDREVRTKIMALFEEAGFVEKENGDCLYGLYKCRFTRASKFIESESNQLIDLASLGEPGLVLGPINRSNNIYAESEPQTIDLNSARYCEVEVFGYERNYFNLSREINSFPVGLFINCDGKSNYYAFEDLDKVTFRNRLRGLFNDAGFIMNRDFTPSLKECTDKNQTCLFERVY